MTDTDDLYGLPRDRFVPQRNALAKALRADGERDRAQEVAALRKPSLAAWAVNQLIRTRGREVEALFDAGDALRQAQSNLLEGRGDGDALREAVGGERDAVDELSELARGLLTSDGQELTQSTLDRVSETLHAAALDEDARAQVKDGRLERELRHVGIGGLGAGAMTPAPPSRATKAAEPSSKRARQRPTQTERAERERVQQEEREREERLKAARLAEKDARRQAERAERELRNARQRRDRAAAALRESEDALSTAGERAEAAALEHQRAQQAVDAL